MDQISGPYFCLAYMEIDDCREELNRWTLSSTGSSYYLRIMIVK